MLWDSLSFRSSCPVRLSKSQCYINDIIFLRAALIITNVVVTEPLISVPSFNLIRTSRCGPSSNLNLVGELSFETGAEREG